MACCCCGPPNPVPSLHRLEKILSVKHKYPNFFPVLWNADCGNGPKAGEKPQNLLLTRSRPSEAHRAWCLWHRAWHCSFCSDVRRKRSPGCPQYLCSLSGTQAGKGPQAPCCVCAPLCRNCTAIYCILCTGCGQASSPCTRSSSENTNHKLHTCVTNHLHKLLSFIDCDSDC